MEISEKFVHIFTNNVHLYCSLIIITESWNKSLSGGPQKLKNANCNIILSLYYSKPSTHQGFGEYQVSWSNKNYYTCYQE